MYTYNIKQWLLFFFIYCFLGWCIESTFVSIKSKKWVNRGFISGPFLPLYGSGAICVLFTSLPFQQMWLLVYLAGAVSATILEYVTGVCMEMLFKVRYWDYSNQKFNFQGHICLSSTLAWGAITVLLIYVIHPPVEYVVLQLPETMVSVVSIVLSVYVGIDFAKSFRVAIDLRDMLIKVENVKQEIRTIQRRLEIIETFTRADLEELQERAAQKLEKQENWSIERLRNIQERLEALRCKLPKDILEKHREELSDIRVQQAVLKERITNYFSLDKVKLLRRNPHAISKKYQDELEEFKEIQKMKKIKELEEIKAIKDTKKSENNQEDMKN